MPPPLLGQAEDTNGNDSNDSEMEDTHDGSAKEQMRWFRHQWHKRAETSEVTTETARPPLTALPAIADGQLPPPVPLLARADGWRSNQPPAALPSRAYGPSRRSSSSQPPAANFDKPKAKAEPKTHFKKQPS